MKSALALAGSAALALAVFAPFSPAAAAGNLVQNGDFSSLTMNGTPSSRSVEIAGGGIQNGNVLTGWNNAGYTFLFQPGGGGVSGTTADTTGSAGFYGNLTLWGPGAGGGSVANGLTNDPAGQAFVGLDGDPSIHGAFSQAISGLTVGQTYKLTFDWAAAQQYFTGQGAANQAAADPNGVDQFLTASFSDGTTTQSASTGVDHTVNQGFSPWRQAAFSFVATSGAETLSFLATGAPSGVPPFTLLSNVSLTVSEPSSLGLLAAGVLALGGFTWSRSRKTKRAGASA